MLLRGPVREVRTFADALIAERGVRNGHLKDSFALQDAESGTIEMKLEWANCYVDDYVG